MVIFVIIQQQYIFAGITYAGYIFLHMAMYEYAHVEMGWELFILTKKNIQIKSSFGIQHQLFQGIIADTERFIVACERVQIPML